MNRYTYDKYGYLLGVIRGLTEFDTYPIRSTTIAPPTISEGEYARFNGNEWSVVTYKPLDGSATITSGQLRIAIKRSGKLADAKAYIQSLGADSEERLKLEHNPTFRRDSDIIAKLQQALSVTDKQIDNVFKEAAEIE